MNPKTARLLLLIIVALALLGLPSCADREPYKGPNMTQWQEIDWAYWRCRQDAREARAEGRQYNNSRPYGCYIYNPYSYTGL